MKQTATVFTLCMDRVPTEQEVEQLKADLGAELEEQHPATDPETKIKWYGVFRIPLNDGDEIPGDNLIEIFVEGVLGDKDWWIEEVWDEEGRPSDPNNVAYNAGMAYASGYHD